MDALEVAGVSASGPLLDDNALRQKVASDAAHATRTTSPALSYRADIDGLRAIAVLAVIGFHAFPRLVPGGFVGVDVFFVISGYLISGIILRDLEHKRFTFRDFYERRIRRIFPSLILVLASIFLVSWPLFIPLELLGKHIASGAGFVSNFAFWNESGSGYFDVTSDTKPLLHLWSLGIEEQFYIIWPLLLATAFARNWRILSLMLAIAGASFAIGIVTLETSPIAAFYSPLSRFWELMIGGVLADLTLRQRLPRQGGNRAAWRSIGGLVLIASSVLLLDGASPFPGWLALLPTLGAFLVISAGVDAWPNKAILRNRALVGIGLISYPLYLWHWPAIFFARYASFATDSSPMRARALVVVAVLVSVVLSWLTYRIVEKPIRSGQWQANVTVPVLCSLMLVTAGAGYAAYRSSFTDLRFAGIDRQAAQQLLRATELSDLKKMYGERPCLIYDQKYTAQMFADHGCFDIPNPQNPTVFLIGDSHSGALSLGLRPFVESRNMNFAQVSSGWCEPTLNDDSNLWCTQINDLMLAKIAQIKPSVVVLSTHWLQASRPPYFVGGGSYADWLTTKLGEIQRLGVRHIVVVGQIPTWSQSLPFQLFNRFTRQGQALPSRTYLGVVRESLEMDQRMKAFSYPRGVSYVSLTDVLCDARGCLTMVGPNPETDVVVWDYGHLTPAGARFVTETALRPALAGLVSNTSDPAMTANPRTVPVRW